MCFRRPVKANSAYTIPKNTQKYNWVKTRGEDGSYANSFPMSYLVSHSRISAVYNKSPSSS